MSKSYTGHNAYLNQQEGESMEDYNKRIGDWEAKVKQEQITRIAELELVEQWVEGERKRIVDKHKDKEMSDFDKGVEVALAYVSKYLEGKRYAREAIFNEPSEYELKLDIDGDYKLSKRK